MKIAVISDIHGNLSALKKVYEKICDHKVEKVICLGDLIGYGNQEGEVIDFIMNNEIECVKGNHEATYLLQLAGELSQKLSVSQLNYIEKLPDVIEWKEKSIIFSHAIPYSNYKYLYANSDFSVMDDIDSKIIFMGHSHYPMYMSYFDKKIINPGSVGQPRDGVLYPAYLICEDDLSDLQFYRAK